MVTGVPPTCRDGVGRVGTGRVGVGRGGTGWEEGRLVFGGTLFGKSPLSAIFGEIGVWGHLIREIAVFGDFGYTST